MSIRAQFQSFRTARPWLAGIALLLLALAGQAPALNDYPRNDLWITDGRVEAVARSADRIYLGGTFRTVARFTGPALLLDSSTGTPDLRLTKLKGERNDTAVHAAIPDGAGGWYLGGRFGWADDTPYESLVHILPDGRPNPNFSFSIRRSTVDGIVRALALSASGVLYVAGEFDSINGQPRTAIAAVDTNTGALTAWAPAVPGGTGASVNALLLQGETVYFGGNGGLRSANAITGTVQSLDNTVSVEALAINGAGNTLYFGGGGGLKAYNIATQTVLPWNPAPNGRIRALAVSGSTVYAGGDFTSIGGQARPYLAAVNADTGAASGWNPAPNGLVGALLLRGNTLHVGGSFTSISQVERSGYAEVDIIDASVGANDPRLNAQAFAAVLPNVDALAFADGRLMLGGYFSGTNAVKRRNIAALDAHTGAATDWAPDADNTVFGLLLDGQQLYAFGNFAQIGGQARARLAALDVNQNTNSATAFVADVGGGVLFDMARAGNALYVAGGFSTINGVARANIAAVDASTGSVTPWNPGTDGGIQAIDIAGDFLYLAGSFTQVNNQFRNRVASVQASTGAVLPFDPNVTNTGPATVLDLLVSEGKVYFVGSFVTVGGQPRAHFAAVDAFTGQATDPVVDFAENTRPLSIAKRGNTLFLANTNGLGTIQGVAVSNVAAVNATTGMAEDWRPVDTTGVNRLSVQGDEVFLFRNSLARGRQYINPSFVRAFPLAADETGVSINFVPAYNALTAGLAPGQADGDVDDNGRQDLDEFACLASLLSQGDASGVPQVASTFELNRDQMAVDLGNGAPAQIPGADALLGGWLMFGNADWIGSYARTCTNCPGSYNPNAYHFTINPDVATAFTLCSIGVSEDIFGNGFE